MNAPARRKPVAQRCALIVSALIVSSVAATPQGRAMRPRFVTFASVARGAELDSLATDTLRPSERAFLREATEMSRTDLRMAQLAVGQATSSDLRTYAQQLMTDYRQIADS